MQFTRTLFHSRQIDENSNIKLQFSPWIKWVAVFLVIGAFASLGSGSHSVSSAFLVGFIVWLGSFLWVTRDVRQEILAADRKGQLIRSGSDWNFKDPSTYFISSNS